MDDGQPIAPKALTVESTFERIDQTVFARIVRWRRQEAGVLVNDSYVLVDMEDLEVGHGLPRR